MSEPFTVAAHLPPSFRRMKLTSLKDLLLLVWFGISFLIHLNGLIPWFFHKQLADPSYNAWFLQTFREFGKTDRRYLTEDNLVICVQGLAGIIDPILCLIVIESILNERHWRPIVIMILSFLQAFGGMLYFMGAYHQQWHPITVVHEPSKFWTSFVFPNCMTIPLALTQIQSMSHLVVCSKDD
jgi:hypothetical protein